MHYKKIKPIGMGGCMVEREGFEPSHDVVLIGFIEPIVH